MINMYNCDALEFIKGDTLNGKRFIVVTDPPFNLGYHYENYDDKKPEDEYYQWLEDIVHSKGNPFVIIHYPESLYKLSFQTKVIPERVIAWVYNSNTPRQHRDIAFFGIKPDLTKATQPYKNPTDKRIANRIENGIEGGKLYDWWEINQVKNVNDEKYAHPCQMPLEIMKRIIAILPEDYAIYDPFMGTGTTALACKELGRDFYGTEIDSKYFKICLDRINEIKPNGQTSIFTDFDKV